MVCTIQRIIPKNQSTRILLRESLDLNGTLATADAMHTQTELAASLVEGKHADYLFIAQGTQPTLEVDIRTLKPEDFSPSGGYLEQRPRAHEY